MIIKKIILSNFQCYNNFRASFAPMTFIKGRNGTGKTTLGLDAILFAVYGYAKKNLADLPTREVSKSCMVTIEVEHEGDLYEITRYYPTKLKIKKNDKVLNYASNAEAQKLLNSLFGDANYFKKFRMIDSSVGINFLEEGQQALKKILFSVSDELFNNAKDKLSQIKHQREIYCKDKAVIYSHFPSEKRLKLLKELLFDIQTNYNELKRTDNALYKDISNQSRVKGNSEGQLKIINNQLFQLKKSTHCYACKQELSKETKDGMLSKKTKEYEELQKAIKTALDTLEELEEIRSHNQKPLGAMENHKNKVQLLITKLEGRLKQKEYKYTQADIENVKKALKELDNISTVYLTQSIRILEPIINSVLEKIDFKVSFEINDKGKFSITLYKKDVKFNYKDLSTGQKLLLQLAFKLALLLERGEEGIMIADEGLSSLDYQNLLHVLNIFENFPFQLIFILHGIEDIPGNVKVIDLNIIKGVEDEET